VFFSKHIEMRGIFYPIYLQQQIEEKEDSITKQKRVKKGTCPSIAIVKT
jgi:hypothetical protein